VSESCGSPANCLACKLSDRGKLAIQHEFNEIAGLSIQTQSSRSPGHSAPFEPVTVRNATALRRESYTQCNGVCSLLLSGDSQ